MRRLPAAFGARLLTLLLATVSCAAADEVVSFNKDVAPVLNHHCVMCHMVGTELGGLSLYPDPRANLVGMQSTQTGLNLVEAGKPQQSYLLLKMLGQHTSVGGTGLAMPWQYALPPGEVELVRLWIAQGAQDN